MGRGVRRAGQTGPEDRRRDAGAELGLGGRRVSEGRAGLGAERQSVEGRGPGTEVGAEAEGSVCRTSKPGHGADPVIPLPSLPIPLSFSIARLRSRPLSSSSSLSTAMAGVLQCWSPPSRFPRALQIWSFAALPGLRLRPGLVLFLFHPSLWPPSESAPRSSIVNFFHPPSVPSEGFRGPEF